MGRGTPNARSSSRPRTRATAERSLRPWHPQPSRVRGGDPPAPALAARLGHRFRGTVPASPEAAGAAPPTLRAAPEATAAAVLPTPGTAGAGRPLPAGVEEVMGRAFGHDFSAVRVHEGTEAAALGAIAFTRGRDLYFAPGRFQPASFAGRKLLGHELAHVVQQRSGVVRRPPGTPINRDPRLEAEAEAAGGEAARGRPAPVREAAAGPQTPTGAGSGVVQCNGGDKDQEKSRFGSFGSFFKGFGSGLTSFPQNMKTGWRRTSELRGRQGEEAQERVQDENRQLGHSIRSTTSGVSTERALALSKIWRRLPEQTRRRVKDTGSGIGGSLIGGLLASALTSKGFGFGARTLASLSPRTRPFARHLGKATEIGSGAGLSWLSTQATSHKAIEAKERLKKEHPEVQPLTRQLFDEKERDQDGP